MNAAAMQLSPGYRGWGAHLTVQLAPNGPADTPGGQGETQQVRALRRLIVEMDSQSARFVQIHLDSSSHEVLLQYPNDGQIHFSRGVEAYVQATWRTLTTDAARTEAGFIS